MYTHIDMHCNETEGDNDHENEELLEDDTSSNNEDDPDDIECGMDSITSSDNSDEVNDDDSDA